MVNRVNRSTLRALLVAVVAIAGIAVSPVLPWLAPLNAGTPGPASKPARPNLLLITLDTTRADRIAPWGPGGVTPTLDALAAESLVATHAYAPAPLTFPSHTSMLTGLYPFAHGVRNNDLYHLDGSAPTVARILQAAGYRTEAIVAASVLRATTGLDLGFERYSDVAFKRGRNGAIEAERPASDVSAELQVRLAIDDPRPFFLWAHYFDAHAPYAAPNGPPSTATLIEQYEAELRYVDSQIAGVLAALRNRKQLATTWIVVCGDHGEGLGIQQEASHSFLCEEGTLRIPLFVRRPDGELRDRLDTLASAVDVAPTLLAAAGLAPPGAVHGLDLVAAARVQAAGGPEADALADRAIWFESWAGWHQFHWARLEGVVAGHFKYVKNVHDELFDLDATPLESKNLAAERPEVLRAMKQRYTELLELPIAHLASAAPSLPPTEVARLLELGYLARMVGDEDTSKDGTLDPRVHYQSCRDLQYAMDLAHLGKIDDSVALLERLIRDYPKNTLFREFLGKVLLQAGRKQAAARVFAAALVIDGDLVASSFNLAVYFRESNQPQDACELLEHVVELNPVHLEARLELRTVHQALRQHDRVLLDVVGIIGLVAELADHESEAIARSALDEWLPDAVKHLARDPRRIERLRRALDELPASTHTSIERARDILRHAIE